MELIDATPVPARCFVAPGDVPSARIGHIVAKATFSFDAAGQAWLDDRTPQPVLDDDLATEVGILPADHLPRRARSFEVVLLGAAHAPAGEIVDRQFVTLRVGAVEHTLVVTGDRGWIRGLGTWRPGEAQPFRRIPLVWANAYGGRARLWLDPHSPLELSEARNPDGRGYVPGDDVLREVQRGLACAPGYPRLEIAPGLPNLEHPSFPLRRPGDAPEPWCWATRPQGSVLAVHRSLAAGLDPIAGVLDRAHPDWCIEVPEQGAAIVLTGMCNAGRIELRLPALRVLADFVVGRSRGTIELAPRMLVLLPEQRQFYLVYRKCFTHVMQAGEERCLRLRLLDGWAREAEV